MDIDNENFFTLIFSKGFELGNIIEYLNETYIGTPYIIEGTEKEILVHVERCKFITIEVSIDPALYKDLDF